MRTTDRITEQDIEVIESLMGKDLSVETRFGFGKENVMRNRIGVVTGIIIDTKEFTLMVGVRQYTGFNVVSIDEYLGTGILIRKL